MLTHTLANVTRSLDARIASRACIALALSLAACGAQGSRTPIVLTDAGTAADARPLGCVPNETVSCTCTGGATGSQTCNASGSAFTAPCACTTTPPPRDSGPACESTGASCGTNGECCNYLSGSGYCVDYGSGGLCADSCSSDSDCRSGCCATLTNGDRTCGPPSACAGGVGDPCDGSAECISGLTCLGTDTWCSTGCSSTFPDCDGIYSGGYNFQGQTNWCVTASSGTNACFPGCSSSVDCYAYPGTSCQTAYTTLGTPVSVCAR